MGKGGRQNESGDEYGYSPEFLKKVWRDWKAFVRYSKKVNRDKKTFVVCANVTRNSKNSVLFRTLQRGRSEEEDKHGSSGHLKKDSLPLSHAHRVSSR